MDTISAYLNPDLFTDTAIPQDTRGLNAALVAAMTNVPNWWEVGAPVVRELRVKGGSVFPRLSTRLAPDRSNRRTGRRHHAAGDRPDGAYDLRMTPTARAFGSERLVLRTVDIEQFCGAFLPGMDDVRKSDSDISPLFANLRGLCPALFTIGTRDALVADTLFMHARWIAAGNRAELDVHPGGAHGFTLLPGTQAGQSQERQAAFLASALA